MSKYNFHELKGKALPEDINEPVKKMLADDLKCLEAIPMLEYFEKHKNCGEIQIFDKKNPKTIRIKVNYGMCEGFDLIKAIDSERFTIAGLKHIKNHKLEMKNNNKGNKNA